LEELADEESLWAAYDDSPKGLSWISKILVLRHSKKFLGDNGENFMMSLDLEIAGDYGECPVCMEPLYKHTPTVFTEEVKGGWFRSDRTKRSCRHLACQGCANTMAGMDSKCPVCRKAFTGIKAIPDLFKHPEDWFTTIDFNEDKALSRQELTDVLKCYFNVDPSALDQQSYKTVAQHIKDNWSKWDANGDGTISYKEFESNLLSFLRQTHTTLENMKDYSEIPDWREDPLAWFDFWDYDKSGTLERREVVRALAKTLKDKVSAEYIYNMLQAVWGAFDSNGDGRIDRQEFKKQDGLLDTMKAEY